MGKSINCNPQKLASIVTYLQKSRTCWNIKDLEKQIPSVASINGMQVKEYVQNLQDDSRISVEKIGSGNWYWSFASQDKKLKQKTLADTQSSNDRIAATVTELRNQLAESVAAHEKDEVIEETREELMVQKAELEADLIGLGKELEAYNDNDPTELERKQEEATKWKEEAEQYSDDIYSLEGWWKKNSSDFLNPLRMGTYGEEWDPEEQDFKALD